MAALILVNCYAHAYRFGADLRRSRPQRRVARQRARPHSQRRVRGRRACRWRPLLADLDAVGVVGQHIVAVGAVGGGTGVHRRYLAQRVFMGLFFGMALRARATSSTHRRAVVVSGAAPAPGPPTVRNRPSCHRARCWPGPPRRTRATPLWRKLARPRSRQREGVGGSY